MKQYVGISRDHSGSMQSLAHAAMRDYNNTIAAVKDGAQKNDIDTIVSVVENGVGSQGKVVRRVVNSSISRLEPVQNYPTDGGSTPLFDSVGELIDILSDVPDADFPDVSFLIIVVTDGEENSSKRWNGSSLSAKIKQLQATDRWTFTFRVPRGCGRTLERLGIPSGNIMEWETTERGMEQSSVVTQSAVSNYFVARAKGVRGSSTFYADLSKPGAVKRDLEEITHEVQLWAVTRGGELIREFVEAQGETYRTGAAFYQLSKSEEVQGFKLICVRHKISGKVYAGENARVLLGLPRGGSIKVSPGSTGEYEVFVQSTSVNRKLIAGTSLIYWTKFRSI